MVSFMFFTSKPVKEAISGYIQDPSGTGQKIVTSMTGTGEVLTVSKENMGKLKDELQKSMTQMKVSTNSKNQVERLPNTEKTNGKAKKA